MCVCVHYVVMKLSTVLFRAFVACVRAAVSLSPRMELPPLSPGIHDSVIDVVVVLVTVRRGWSGGTEDKQSLLHG